MDWDSGIDQICARSGAGVKGRVLALGGGSGWVLKVGPLTKKVFSKRKTASFLWRF